MTSQPNIFVNYPILYQESIDKIATNLNIKKYLEKDIETGGVIGHEIMSNYGDSIRGSVLDTCLEESENMKDKSE